MVAVLYSYASKNDHTATEEAFAKPDSDGARRRAEFEDRLANPIQFA
jgi:hypothetical protein